MSNQGIFWVKVNLDPSIHHDLPSKSLNFWLELDPTCTIGTAINRMKNGFGIAENVALFLEGYFLPTWMSAAMLMHAKEPVFVQPWIAESRIYSFADMADAVSRSPKSQTFCSCNKEDRNANVNNNNNNESSSVAVIIKANSLSPRYPNPLASPANLAGKMVSKLETPDGKNVSEEMNEVPRKKVGRPPRPRKAPAKSKTPDPDVNNDDDQDKYDTTPTSRRRSRRLAKTPIQNAILVSSNPNKRKPDGDLQASPQDFVKRSRTVSKSPVGSSKSLTNLKTVPTLIALDEPVRQKSQEDIHTATEVKLFEASKKLPDCIDIDAFFMEAGITAPKEEVIQEDVVSTPTEVIAPAEKFVSESDAFMVSLNELTGELQAVQQVSTVPVKSPQIQQGCWIKFQETMEGPMEIGPYTVDNISYVAFMNGPMMTLTCPDYDSIDQPDCLKWKQRVLNLETISSSAQIITQEEALQTINETYPIRSIFNSI